jgi:hypothetical protein
MPMVTFTPFVVITDNTNIILCAEIESVLVEVQTTLERDSQPPDYDLDYITVVITSL